MKGWEILKLADESDGVGKMWHCKNFTGSNSADWFIAVTEDGYVDWFDKQTNDPINGDFNVRYLQEKEWEEYKPQVDWGKVPKDTKVLVWDEGDTNKFARHFKEYKKRSDFPFIVFNDGRTSWSTGGAAGGWEHCELAEDAEADNE